MGILAEDLNDSEHEYPVDRAMGHKVTDGVNYYYIHWKGYPAEDDSWEHEENITKETLDLWHNSIETRQTSRISCQNLGGGVCNVPALQEILQEVGVTSQSYKSEF